VDLDINTCGKIELFQLVNRSGSGIKDVKETLVSPNFELVSSLFVLVHRCVDGEFFDPGGKRNRTGDFGTSALGSLNNLPSRAINSSVVKCAKADTDFLIHGVKSV